jgi:hypothetical protein
LSIFGYLEKRSVEFRDPGHPVIAKLAEAQRLEKLRLIQDRGNAGKAYQTTGDYDAVLRSHCRLDIRKP